MAGDTQKFSGTCPLCYGDMSHSTLGVPNAPPSPSSSIPPPHNGPASVNLGNLITKHWKENPWHGPPFPQKIVWWNWNKKYIGLEERMKRKYFTLVNRWKEQKWRNLFLVKRSSLKDGSDQIKKAKQEANIKTRSERLTFWKMGAIKSLFATESNESAAVKRQAEGFSNPMYRMLDLGVRWWWWGGGWWSWWWWWWRILKKKKQRYELWKTRAEACS